MMKGLLLVLVLSMSTVCSTYNDGGLGCLKACGSWFSNCYKTCFVPSYDNEIPQMKRDNDCLDGCILKLSTCHHYCSSK